MRLITLGRMDPLEHVAVITLERPEHRNALSALMLDELTACLGDLAMEPGLRAVVIAGSGRDFCAGADVAELGEALSVPAAAEYGRSFDEAFAAIAEHPVPVIARVHGAALGAGCLLALACDLAVAEADARIGIPSGRLGIVLSYEAIERTVLAIGPKQATELLLTGRILSGAEAGGWGLVNRAVPTGDLDAAVSAMATAVAEAAPLSIRASKRGVATVAGNLRLDRSTRAHLLGDFEMMAARAMASDDLREGLSALAERRPPRFSGS